MSNKIEWISKQVKLKDLRDYPNNPRKMSKNDFERLVNDIKQDGYRNRIIVNTDLTILGGHSRKKALLAGGFKNDDSIEVLYPTRELSEQEVQRINIRDNLPFGEFDFDILANNFDAPSLIEWGMPPEWLAGTIAEVLEGEDDPVPSADTSKPATTVLGDIWLLGNHRLMCGDSTSMTDIDKLMNCNKVDMVYTDPPYGMKLDTNYSKINLSAAASKKWSKSNSYAPVIGDNEDFNPEFITSIFAAFNYCKEIFIWGSDYFAELLPNKNDGSWVVWDKRVEENLEKFHGSVFELCWSKQKHRREIARIKWSGIIGMEQEFDSKRHHPTQKPLQLAKWFFDKWGSDAKSIVDLYGGSGSTLLACEDTARQCYMMELSPHYCDVIISRWEKLTGQKAELEAL